VKILFFYSSVVFQSRVQIYFMRKDTTLPQRDA